VSPFRRLRRVWTVLDWTAATLCAVIIIGVLIHTEHVRYGVGARAATWPLVLLIALGLAFPVTIRRKAPIRALAIVLAGCVVLLVVGASLTSGPILPLCLVLYVVATTCRRNLAVAGLAAALALLVLQGLLFRLTGFGPGDSVGGALFLIIVWTVGYAVQQRRTYLAHLRDRATSDAVTRERLRIARELHDVVAHSMTVVTVQAGFGEYVFDSQPAEARAALGAIQAVSREALGEMQRMLCVLRQPETDAAPGDAASPASPAAPVATPADTTAGAAAGAAAGPGPAQGRRPRLAAALAPAPGLASLGRLVQRTAGAGVTVTVERTGTVRPLPAGLDLSAFRIVQEALTNVVKHSGADRCQVRLDYGPADLLIEVTDHGAATPVTVGAAAGGAGMTGRPAGAAALNGAPAKAAPTAALPTGPAVAGTGLAGTGLAGTGLAGTGFAGTGFAGTGFAGTGFAGTGFAGTGFVGTAQRAGHGIVGMRERVSLSGGEFSAAPRPGGGFVVRARLPLDSRS
jgi:signal transduction histidine kinase